MHHRPVALFCISSLGLGHATRTLPVIRRYEATHDLHILSTGNALAYLRRELGETAGATFHDYPDYPPLERGTGWRFGWYLVIDSLSTLAVIRREHAFIKKLAAEIRPAFIFSDGRYGAHVRGVPSFMLSHQIAFIMPRGWKMFGNVADWFNRRSFAKFDALFIPDYPDEERNLSGSLSHHPALAGLIHHYVGILSSLERGAGKDAEKARDIDYLFTISGYLNEHRPSFIDALVKQARTLPGVKAFVLGRPAEGESPKDLGDGITIYPSASGALRQSLFSRARRIVSRSGYTTVMDLVELGVPGLLIPTPGQTEQEYLAERYARNGYFTIMPDKDFDLKALAKNVSAKSLFKAPWKTSESIRKISNIIDRHAVAF